MQQLTAVHQKYVTQMTNPSTPRFKNVGDSSPNPLKIVAPALSPLYYAALCVCGPINDWFLLPPTNAADNAFGRVRLCVGPARTLELLTALT